MTVGAVPEAPMTVDDARGLLPCRPGACRSEVQATYRRVMRQLRPDLGQVSGEQMALLQSARVVLLNEAGPDRRRWTRPSGERRPLRDVLPRRRSTWQLPSEPQRSIDHRL